MKKFTQLEGRAYIFCVYQCLLAIIHKYFGLESLLANIFSYVGKYFLIIYKKIIA